MAKSLIKWNQGTMTLQIEDLKKLVEAKGFSVRGTAKNLIERVEENGVSSKAKTA